MSAYPGPTDLIVAAGGWVAPSEATWDLVDPLRVDRWPAGLLPEDIEWLAKMLHVAEIEPDPDTGLEFPTISVRRGGITFPV